MHRSIRRFTVANAAAAALLAACFGPAYAANPAQPRGSHELSAQAQAPATVQARTKTGAAQGTEVSRVHGQAIQHLPATCQTVAYADIHGIAATDPVQANRELIRERARMMLERNPSFSASVHKALDALAAHGIDWKKDVDEVAVCAAGERIEAMTIAGAFDGKDLVGALVSGAPDAGASGITSVERNGHTYAVIDQLYAAQITPSVLTIAPDIAQVDASRKRGPDLAQRGGQASDIAFFRSVRPSGHIVVSTVQPTPNDFVVLTTIHNPRGSFDAAKEKGFLRDEIAKLANELRATPLASTADAVQKTDVTVHGNEARMRTELPKKEIRQAIAAAVVSHRDDWLAILPRQAPAMGGGPGQPSEPQQPQNQPQPEQQQPQQQQPQQQPQQQQPQQHQPQQQPQNQPQPRR